MAVFANDRGLARLKMCHFRGFTVLPIENVIKTRHCVLLLVWKYEKRKLKWFSEEGRSHISGKKDKLQRHLATNKIVWQRRVCVMSLLAKNCDIDSMEIVNYNVKMKFCLRCFLLAPAQFIVSQLRVFQFWIRHLNFFWNSHGN